MRVTVQYVGGPFDGERRRVYNPRPEDYRQVSIFQRLDNGAEAVTIEVYRYTLDGRKYKLTAWAAHKMTTTGNQVKVETVQRPTAVATG